MEYERCAVKTNNYHNRRSVGRGEIRDSYRSRIGNLLYRQDCIGTENRINVARQRYNQAVEKFNAAIRKFPYNLTNSLLLHLERKEYFKAEEAAKTAPKVTF